MLCTDCGARGWDGSTSSALDSLLISASESGLIMAQHKTQQDHPTSSELYVSPMFLSVPNKHPNLSAGGGP